MTQYCQGVATGTQTCPASNQFTRRLPDRRRARGRMGGRKRARPRPPRPQPRSAPRRQRRRALRQYDRRAEPQRPVRHRFPAPAPTRTATRPAVSAPGTTTTATRSLASPRTYGDIAFTNMPYVTDVGASCGENFINAGTAGHDDGFSIVNGHEYAETSTDQNPAGGWTNTASGEENGDLCAWSSGPGAPAANLSLTTGTFAMQSTWGNDGAAAATASSATRSSPTEAGRQHRHRHQPGQPEHDTVHQRVSLQIHASDCRPVRPSPGQPRACRPAFRSILHRPDQRHRRAPGPHVQRHRDRHRHHGGSRVGQLHLDGPHLARDASAGSVRQGLIAPALRRYPAESGIASGRLDAGLVSCLIDSLPSRITAIR